MANPDPMVGVILAAGKGARMYPFSERSPKPILPITGSTFCSMAARPGCPLPAVNHIWSGPTEGPAAIA